MDNSFVKSPQEVCQFFKVDSSKGLNSSQVKEQQKNFGRNGKQIYNINIETITDCVK